MKSQFSVFNDGVAAFYKKTDPRKNIKTVDDLEYKLKADFNEQSRRAEDVEFAMQNGHTLSLKIKTRFFGEASADWNVVINKVIYAIINVDYDRANQESYFYLEEIRRIES